MPAHHANGGAQSIPARRGGGRRIGCSRVEQRQQWGEACDLRARPSDVKEIDDDLYLNNNAAQPDHLQVQEQQQHLSRCLYFGNATPRFALACCAVRPLHVAHAQASVSVASEGFESARCGAARGGICSRRGVAACCRRHTELS